MKKNKGILFIAVGILFFFVKFYDLSKSSPLTSLNYLLAILFIIIGAMDVWEGVKNGER